MIDEAGRNIYEETVRCDEYSAWASYTDSVSLLD